MFFDHRKFRSSNRITVVAAKIGIGDVVEFVHEVTAPKKNVRSSGPFARAYGSPIYLLCYGCGD